MRIQARWPVTVAAVTCLLLGGAGSLQAAQPPAIYATIVGKDAATGRPVLTVVGKSLTKLGGFTLRDSDGAVVPGTVDLLLKSKATLVLGLPAGLAGGEYEVDTVVGSSEGPSIGFLFESGAVLTGSPGDPIPAEGAGTRTMWYPGKGAFRAGQVTGTQWDDANTGISSFAAGQDTTAAGDFSAALGFATSAGGDFATSFGNTTTASGAFSTSLGSITTASGMASTATGVQTHATGDGSIAMGILTTSSGAYSAAMGFGTTSQAYASLAIGQYNVAAGDTGLWIAGDPVLVVGNGAPLSPSNAFTLLKNGNLTIAGTLTESSDARIKRDVAPLAGVLRKVAAIRGVSYRFRDDARGPAGTQIGLLAQEVREVYPELVREDARGTLSVAYGNFSAVLLEAVKEQQAVLDRQQAALDARDREVAALRKELADVRASVEARLARLEERRQE